VNCLQQPLAQQLTRAPQAWQGVLAAWQFSAAGQSLIDYVDARVTSGCAVYPAQPLHALQLTPLAQVKVVILGQDPYHGPGQAQGLAFSVAQGQRMPPSLRNILTELERDLGVRRSSTDLSSWAEQGVLLLNTVLTVENGRPASHAKRGWELLAQTVLQAIAARGQACAYLLWGAHAQQFEALIRQAPCTVHPLVLKANHPSPLSARRPPVPFLGCGHFGQVRAYLAAHHQTSINWLA
jgi:uracil-DNA glycosylase